VITAHYTANGKVYKVYHRAGNITADGVVRKDEKYIWTHKPNKQCDACEKGTIPADIKRGERER